MRALGDMALLDAMRDGVWPAWAEFDDRFRPLLDTVAGRLDIPFGDRGPCISEVLEDAAMSLAAAPRRTIANLSGYLVNALRLRWAQTCRADARRARHYQEAAGGHAGHVGEPRQSSYGEPSVIRTCCSEATIRASEGRAAPAPVADAVMRLARVLEGMLSGEEQLLLTWIAEGVPRRLIAEWTGVNYETMRKRLTRLTARLRAATRDHARTFSPEEQRVLARFLDPAVARPLRPPAPDGSRGEFP